MYLRGNYLFHLTQFIEQSGIPELQQPGVSYAEATMRSDEGSTGATITTKDVMALTLEDVPEKLAPGSHAWAVMHGNQHSCADRTWAVMHGDNEGALKMAHEGAALFASFFKILTFPNPQILLVVSHPEKAWASKSSLNSLLGKLSCMAFEL